MRATVTGAFGGRVYQLHLGPRPNPVSKGCDLEIESLLAANVGRTLARSVAGPVTVLDTSDPRSVLIALIVLTDVTHLNGSARGLLPIVDDEPGGIH